MDINYDDIDVKCRNTIKYIEARPHVRYIRYLLTKRYSPIMIKQELQRLGLSSPHEKALTTYYLAVIDPVLKKLKLSYLYSDYKNKLLKAKSKRGDYSKYHLNYRLDLGDDLDGQVKFCKFIKELEVEQMWITEIMKVHGFASNLPVDELGNRILSTTAQDRTPAGLEKILTCDNRFIIDKLLLENVPTDRIAIYCRDNLKLRVYSPDIKMYKNMFFNIQAQTVEDKIKSLTAEKNSLNQFLADLEDNRMKDDKFIENLSLGDKKNLIEQTQKRIEDLDVSIRSLNAKYTEDIVKIAAGNQQDFEDMFAEVALKSFQRFKILDEFKDRDIVDVLLKTVKMMGYAYDKVESIKNLKNGSSDVHSKAVLLTLVNERMEDIVNEQKMRAAKELDDEDFGNVAVDDIDGIDEVTMNINDDEEEQ